MTTASATTGQSTDKAVRIVTVVTSRGEKTKFSFTGNKWEHLERMLRKGGTDIKGKEFNGYSLDNMKCVEGINKHTLEHPDAIVPNTDFHLFIMPLQSKSGAKTIDRPTAYAKIKKFIEKNGDAAKAHFTVKGKPYNQLSTDKLVELIESYSPGTKAKVKKNKSDALTDVATSVLECDSEEEVEEHLEGLSAGEKTEVMIKVFLQMKKGTLVSGVVSGLADKAKESNKREETAEEKAAREEQEQDSKETEELMGEMNSISRGFKDVKR